MTKAPSPLLGYNNNVRHKNRTFHIQTEDSGVKHPHVITHLFMDGGRILKSVKRSYAEHIGADGMAETVRQLMKDQHKQMFIALRDGQFDPLIDSALGITTAGNSIAPESKEAREAREAKESASKETRRGKSQRPPPVSVPPIERANTIPTPAPDELEPSTEREHDHEGLRRGISDLPPPPANLFAKAAATETRYRSQPGAEEHVGGGRSGRGSKPPGPPSRPPSKRPSAPPSDGRYAAARPASIFGSNKPQKGTSIFGEDLISDKSLDEVILSYLAEDLETETKK